ncbi:putative quinol monooxygenase [Luteitalea sp. TBR-22]|uniref:putative quinol monooxygenase n=1 Tax=Luteitalea sp. TBR-22 TaxID=2802971 RepID=UPI001EF5637A|nr:putative quinol monooxygenase [Luteitalea sp. TBR-22]
MDTPAGPTARGAASSTPGDPGVDRRGFLCAAVGVGLARRMQEPSGMYGLIGKITATPGNREALAAILLDFSVAGMPGCLSYIVARDPSVDDALWVTEVWDSEASHKASLSLPAVREAISRARPLIAGFSDRVVTRPLGGIGLAANRAG